MTFGKKQKQEKTQYEAENQVLGRNAYSQIQPAADRMGDLTMNPDEYRQKMMNTYYNPEKSAEWSDAQRNILNTMANATAHNYAATGGGVSSSGNKYYDNNQRNMNDYAARLYDRGVQGANALYQGDLNNTRNYYSTMLGQHNLAQTGDAIDAYNKVLDEANKTWWTEPLTQVGNAVEQFAPGWWKAIGTGMKMGANAGSKDYSDSLARLGGQFGASNDPTSYSNSATDFGGLVSSGANNWMNWSGLKTSGLTNALNNNGTSQGDSWEELVRRNGWEKYLDNQ